VIVGDGPEMRRLKQKAAKNIEFLGEVDDAQLSDIYARCRAFLFAADEDFGLVPLEAHSYGRPVIALGKGGALETVVGSYAPAHQQGNGDEPALTGVFFRDQTPDSLAEAILAFESSEEVFVPEHIQSHARKFDKSIFLDRMRNYLNGVLARK
jgi:glycosyltransferase involved in cell wall biosynthesis